MESNKLKQPDGGEDPPLNYPANNHMQHFIISAEDVNWQVTHLNTNRSEGADEIHPKIIACLASFLAFPFSRLCNNSLVTVKIRVEWKSSVICPIYKKGCKNNFANYRPICLMHRFCLHTVNCQNSSMLNNSVLCKYSFNIKKFHFK